MPISWDSLAHLQNFFQLNFLFTGLEVSSSIIFVARVFVFLVISSGLLWAVYRILIKVLDCLQAFLGGLGALPGAFFLLILLAIPVSQDSLGARWIGYILLLMSILGVAALGALALVLWKYGVDQALRLINSLRSTEWGEPAGRNSDSAFPPDNIIRPMNDPGLTRPSGKEMTWSVPG